MECYGNGLLEDIPTMAPQSTVFDPGEATDDLRTSEANQNECYWNGFSNLPSPDRCLPGNFLPGSGDYWYHPLAPDFQAAEGNLPSFSFAGEWEEVMDLLDSTPTRTCKSEPAESTQNGAEEGRPIVVATAGERKNRARNKKPEGQGQCSKNLMAERRRRKRVNDRLAMLRSIVPKISRVDRTSILGDTVDYMKELLQKITDLQIGNGLDILKDMKANEMLVRNTPKFEVERANGRTRIEMCCADRPGLLLSTISTLEESSGMEIESCVISCFNDFALQATCSDGKIVRADEDLKQALVRNAGYEGKQ